MLKIQCANPKCSISWEEMDERSFMYCSVECAVYDGVYSIRTGFNQEKLTKKQRCDQTS